MDNKYQRKITDTAQQDITSTVNYIAINLCNVKASNDLLKKIRSAADNICMFPRAHTDCKCFMIDDENIRHTTIDNYVLIYEISDETKQINILRFVYAKKNLINIAVK